MTMKWQRYGLTSVLLSSRWWVTYSPPCMMMWQNTITRRYSLASVFQEGICTFIPALLGEDWEQLASLDPPDYCNVWFRQDCLPFGPPRAVETRPTQVLQEQSGSVWVFVLHPHKTAQTLISARETWTQFETKATGETQSWMICFVIHPDSWPWLRP